MIILDKILQMLSQVLYGTGSMIGSLARQIIPVSLINSVVERIAFPIIKFIIEKAVIVLNYLVPLFALSFYLYDSFVTLVFIYMPLFEAIWEGVIAPILNMAGDVIDAATTSGTVTPYINNIEVMAEVFFEDLAPMLYVWYQDVIATLIPFILLWLGYFSTEEGASVLTTAFIDVFHQVLIRVSNPSV